MATRIMRPVKWIKHNPWIVIGVVLWGMLTVAIAGCQPKTTSLLHPPAKVTGIQLQAEIAEVQGNYDILVKKAEIAKADLAAQYAFRAKLIDMAGGIVNIATTGGLNATTGAAAALQLLTLIGVAGLALDNRRKDGVIAAKKATSTSAPAG